MGNFTAAFVPAPDMGHDSWTGGKEEAETNRQMGEARRRCVVILSAADGCWYCGHCCRASAVACGLHAGVRERAARSGWHRAGACGRVRARAALAHGWA